MDQLNHAATKIGLALRSAVSFVESADIPAGAPIPLSEEEAAVRVAELLETVRYDEMKYEELHAQTRGETQPHSRERLNAIACEIVMKWRSLITQAHIHPVEVTVWNTGEEPRHHVEPIPEKLRESLCAYIAYFNQLNAEARKRYLTLESPEFEAHIEALIQGTATQCFYNQQVRAKAGDSAWGDWQR